ncbi:GNAT family N-acetyltransferase [Nocardia sp. GCM10030253]|uniref:GNAT family N-acetyltransferase n=1 Tax=Nocardia sp. GCM10030253 TaxID=3273404 RepID=UPI00362BE5A2
MRNNPCDILVGVAEVATGEMRRASKAIWHGYENIVRNSDEAAINTAVCDAKCYGEINTDRGLAWRSHPSDGTAGARRVMQQHVITDATVTDADDIVRVFLDGCREAYKDLPVVKKDGGVDVLIADMTERKPADFSRQLADDSIKFFVHRTPEGKVDGFIEATIRPDGRGQLYAWHVSPELHRTGVARALMRTALEYMGDVAVHSNTTNGTKAYGAHRNLGFTPVGKPTSTPPPMAAAGLVGWQQNMILSREARAALLARWDQQDAML